MRPSCLIVACSVGASTSAAAFTVSLTNETSGPLVRWPTPTLHYRVNPACSADLPSATCLAAVDASFAAWLDQSCSGIQFQKDAQAFSNPQLQLTAFGYDNGKNELSWIEDSRWVYGEYVLGVTAPFYNPQNGEITEADIVFNGYQQTWQTDGEDFSTDVKSVVTHEVGHFFGLQHVLYGFSSADPPTMAPEVDPYMKTRTPSADDIRGLCFLYPSGSYACASNADCPALLGDTPNGEVYVGQLTCDASKHCGGISNEIPVGTAQLGDDCVGSGDCVDGMTCYPISASGGICASACTPSTSDCPGGFTCVPYDNDPNSGLCFADITGGTKGIGETCATSDECASRLCAPDSGGPKCRQPCHQDSNCLPGQTCAPMPGSALGACLDQEVTPEARADGEPCDSSDQCQSGLCAGSGVTFTCTKSCAGGGSCPSGYACMPVGGSDAGCFPTENKPTGDSCETGTDCASGLCFEGPNATGWCAGPCQTTPDCPCGMQCETTQYYDDQNHLQTELLCNLGEAVGCLAKGADCASAAECAGGACFRGVCEQACSALLAGGGCPSGQGCARMDPAAIDGVCTPPGANPEGAPCGQDNACASLFCQDHHCATACNPFAPSSCGIGRNCQATSDAQIGVCVEATTEPEAEAGPEPSPESNAEVTGEPTESGDTSVSVGAGRSSGCAASGPPHSFSTLVGGLLVGVFLVLSRARAQRGPGARTSRRPRS
ncbi:MAG: matrixin family metalloprotease [Myxococcota bacterium]